ncbi:MAG: PTS sugar transporter subunit IIA [Kiritimatiellae bacterium]|nr:PTS sugar transporter subunit IIA [Kiritimatiellia bacterium]
MHPVVKDLIELHQLGLVKEEHRATNLSERVEHLNESMATLLGRLPADIEFLYRKMSDKGLSAVAPISNGICSGCGLNLPLSLIQAVRAEKDLHQCHNCARVLYYPEELPKRKKEPGRRVEQLQQRQSGMARFSSESLMIPGLRATDRDGVIREFAQKMAAEGLVDDAAKLAEQSLRREALATTAVENTLAFPHVRNVEGGGIAFALGTSRKGVKFGAPGRKLTRIVFFTVIPTVANAVYLQLLSGLTKTFSEAATREKILAADSPKKLWAALSRATKAVIR